jgi:uncharacterized membrane-anchored protein YhcB (DUF1043 family)
MNADTGHMIDYLQHLEALGMELENAMAAVGANALSRFEESLGNQQSLCSRLQALGGKREAAGRQAEPLSLRLREAAESLQKLNRCYASLIRHSSESVRQLAGLKRSYMDDSPARHHYWSCEL